MLMVFNAYILSRLEYGAQAFCCAPPNILHKLDVIQNQALRIIARVPLSTPIDSLHCELGIPPLTIRRKILSLRYWLKKQSFTPNNPVNFLKPVSQPHIGLYSKHTQRIGDSFATYVEKVRTLGGIIDKPGITFPTTVPYPWDQTPVNIAYEIKRSIRPKYLPLKRCYFRP